MRGRVALLTPPVGIKARSSTQATCVLPAWSHSRSSSCRKPSHCPPCSGRGSCQPCPLPWDHSPWSPAFHHSPSRVRAPRGPVIQLLRSRGLLRLCGKCVLEAHHRPLGRGRAVLGQSPPALSPCFPIC